MDIPTPRPGQVIRYEYLWKRESDRGFEDGRKERPCALLLSQQMRDGRTEVFVLPITHSPPIDLALAIEIPQVVKRRLRLDEDRSWIVLSELNRTPWPNQDTRVITRLEARDDDLWAVARGALQSGARSLAGIGRQKAGKGCGQDRMTGVDAKRDNKSYVKFAGAARFLSFMIMPILSGNCRIVE